MKHIFSLHRKELVLARRALRFAYTPVDLRNVQEVCRRCRITPPRGQYTLRLTKVKLGWVWRLRQTGRTPTTISLPAKAAVRALERVRRGFQDWLNAVAAFQAGIEV